VGVRDISEVPGDAWGSGNQESFDHFDGKRQECYRGMVGRRARAERDESTEPCGDRVGVGDGTRREHGACGVHGSGSRGADGLRSDSMGDGDISEVPGDAWGPGDTTGGADGRGAGRERDAGMVGRRARAERDASSGSVSDLHS
jgi:hypothetical protein